MKPTERVGRMGREENEEGQRSCRGRQKSERALEQCAQEGRKRRESSRGDTQMSERDE